VATKKKAGKRQPVRKAETVASDDALREELRNFDVRKLDRAIAKAIAAPRSTKR
jgi:hypothetical protein